MQFVYFVRINIERTEHQINCWFSIWINNLFSFQIFIIGTTAIISVLINILIASIKGKLPLPDIIRHLDQTQIEHTIHTDEVGYNYYDMHLCTKYLDLFKQTLCNNNIRFMFKWFFSSCALLVLPQMLFSIHLTPGEIVSVNF